MHVHCAAFRQVAVPGSVHPAGCARSPCASPNEVFHGCRACAALAWALAFKQQVPLIPMYAPLFITSHRYREGIDSILYTGFICLIIMMLSTTAAQ